MNKYLFFCTTFLLIAVSVSAQQREPAWRIINNAPGTNTPNYAQEKNPFPTIKIKSLPKPEVDLEALRKAQTRAELLHELRQIILKNNAYTPDFSPYKATGYLVGEHGPRALMGGHWVRRGDVITVNISGTKHILTLHERLKELDPKAAKNLNKDLARIVPESNKIKTTVTEITPTHVHLKDTLGRRYTTPIK